MNFDCYYCSFSTKDQYEYECHVIQRHYPHGLCYPNLASIRKKNLVIKGKAWEV